MADLDRALARLSARLGEVPPGLDDRIWARLAGQPAVVAEPTRRRLRLVLVAAALTAGLAAAVAIVAIRQPVPAPAPTTTVVGTFSGLAASVPSSDPDVLRVAAAWARDTGAAEIAPRRLPSDDRDAIYVVAGPKRACIFAMRQSRGVGGGCTTVKTLSNPRTPVLWLGRALDDTIVMTALVPDTVTAVEVVTASGARVPLAVEANVASGRLPGRPARVISTLTDGSTTNFEYDLGQPLDEILPPLAAKLGNVFPPLRSELVEADLPGGWTPITWLLDAADTGEVAVAAASFPIVAGEPGDGCTPNSARAQMGPSDAIVRVYARIQPKHRVPERPAQIVIPPAGPLECAGNGSVVFFRIGDIEVSAQILVNGSPSPAALRQAADMIASIRPV